MILQMRLRCSRRLSTASRGGSRSIRDSALGRLAAGFQPGLGQIGEGPTDLIHHSLCRHAAGCSSSPRQMPLRSVPPSIVAASYQPQLSCAGCSPASPTTRRRGSAPGLSPAGNRSLPRRRDRLGCLARGHSGQSQVADALVPYLPERIGLVEFSEHMPQLTCHRAGLPTSAPAEELEPMARGVKAKAAEPARRARKPVPPAKAKAKVAAAKNPLPSRR